ncbi:NAD(P)H-dependent oxidoreductase [Actinoallomurus acanthiterrae]
MTDRPLRLAVIIGSIRDGRFGPTVATWFAGEAARRTDSEVDLIDLADVPIGAAAPSVSPPPQVLTALGDLTPRLEAADGFVIVTPEYNHSYPAALKNAIDWHNAQFHAKPVAFVSYGGLSRRTACRGASARGLRRTSCRHHEGHDQLPRHVGVLRRGRRPKDPNGQAMAAKTLLDQLTWWARVLRDAKATTPYNA